MPESKLSILYIIIHLFFHFFPHPFNLIFRQFNVFQKWLESLLGDADKTRAFWSGYNEGWKAQLEESYSVCAKFSVFHLSSYESKIEVCYWHSASSGVRRPTALRKLVTYSNHSGPFYECGETIGLMVLHECCFSVRSAQGYWQGCQRGQT